MAGRTRLKKLCRKIMKRLIMILISIYLMAGCSTIDHLMRAIRVTDPDQEAICPPIPKQLYKKKEAANEIVPVGWYYMSPESVARNERYKVDIRAMAGCYNGSNKTGH